MDLGSLARRLPLPPVALDAVARALRRRRRRAIAQGYFADKLRAIERWLDESNETTNFTCDLTALNRTYLAAFVHAVAGCPRDRAAAYFAELEGDEELARHVRATTEGSPHRSVADPVARYGRRLGWYALVRALRPRLVVETGVDKGLGACVLAAALRRNAAEGHPGRYVGTDLSPTAGWLFTGSLAAHGQVLHGDSIASLSRLEGPVDLFIADSDHAYEYESREYRTIEPRLGPGALLLSDNAHCCPALHDFAARTGRRFLFWREEPRDHWYPGAGIGAAWSAG